MSSFDTLLMALRAAGEATRLRVVLLLAQGEMTVSELAALLDQSQPRVSRHLKVLAEAGLVERYQEGAWVFYRLAPSPLSEGLGWSSAETARSLLPEADRAGLEALRVQRKEAATAFFEASAPEWEAIRTRQIDETSTEAAMRRMAGPRAERFVDLGTGTGRMLVCFADLYDAGVGYDLSPEMLAIARARLSEAGVAHATVRRADVLSDPLAEEWQGRADIVCLHHVLHFLAEPDRALAVARDFLAPGGRILVADFAPHDHEDLRDRFAHRRLGFADEEIAGWAGRLGLRVGESARLDPPEPGGLVTRLWRLDAPPTEKTRPTREAAHVPA